MNTKLFLKLAGKKFTLTSNGEYIFNAPVVDCMTEVQAWHNLCGASVHERDGYRFHLVYALNGTYFKYDGPGSEERCINLFVEDIKTGDCWLNGCLILRSVKDGKKSIRRYRDIALNAPISEIEETRKKEQEMYSYRYMSNAVAQ